MNNDVLIRVEGVSKKFCRDLKRSLWYGVKDAVSDVFGREGSTDLRRDEFLAVNDVSFEVRRGECLGLVGRNGAGKTTLLKMLNGLIKPDHGRIEMRGRVGALIALGAGFNPILTGRENIYVNGSVLGLSRKEIDRKLEDIINFAEIGDFIDSPVQSYSSGMHVRLGFAVATAMEPDILLLDEVLAVGDANFQAKCYQRIGKTLTRCAVILVSHYAYHIIKLCNQTLLLNKGSVAATGASYAVLREYARSQDVESAPLRIVHDSVVSTTINCVTKKLSYGEKLQIKLLVEMKRPVRCDRSSHLNIVDEAENVHAQAVLTQHAFDLEKGRNELTILVGPLYLSEGKFLVNLIILTSDGKETLVQIRNSVRFTNSGPISMGVFYYPPTMVDIRKEKKVKRFESEFRSGL